MTRYKVRLLACKGRFITRENGKAIIPAEDPKTLTLTIDAVSEAQCRYFLHKELLERFGKGYYTADITVQQVSDYEQTTPNPIELAKQEIATSKDIVYLEGLMAELAYRERRLSEKEEKLKRWHKALQRKEERLKAVEEKLEVQIYQAIRDGDYYPEREIDYY